MDKIKKTDATEIVFTGHSLGGAVAQLSFLRYITFCETFPDNEASRFKSECSFISYAAPINTSIEVVNKFSAYNIQMHSIDQHNDPIIEIVRDIERVFNKITYNNPNKENDDYIDEETYVCIEGDKLSKEAYEMLHEKLKENGTDSVPNSPREGSNPDDPSGKAISRRPSLRSLLPFGIHRPVSMPLGYHHIVLLLLYIVH